MAKVNPKARAKTKLTDDQKWGAVEFEPWTKEALEASVPVSNKVWNEIGHDHLPTVRIAWIALGKTKEELKEIVIKLPDEANLLEDLHDGVQFFRRYAELLELAELRFLVAGSALLTEGKIAG
jgi:hypothetical protein